MPTTDRTRPSLILSLSKDERMLSFVNSLATLGYGMLTDITPANGAVYTVVVAFRVRRPWCGSMRA